MTAAAIGWAVHELREVARLGSGGTPRAREAKYYEGGSIPWAVIGDLKDRPILETATCITDAALAESSAKLVPPGALLIAMYGSIGKLAITQIEMATNQAIAFAIPDRDVLDTRFLFHYFMSQREALARLGKGATQQNISQTILRSWPVPVPPLGEQRRIVEILEDHLSRLDAAERITQGAIRRLSRLRDAAAQSALAAARTCSIESQLGDLVEPNRRIAYGVLVPGPHVPDGVPLIRVGDLQDGGIDATAIKRISPEIAGRFKRTFVAGGEVLLSLVGTIGRTAVVPSALAGANVARAVGVLPLVPEAQPDFVSTILSAPEIQRLLNHQAHEVARKTLNLEDVRRLTIPLPDPVEQRRILDRYVATLDALHRLRSAAEAALVRAHTFRQTLLSAALSGQLTAHAPDPHFAKGLASV